MDGDRVAEDLQERINRMEELLDDLTDQLTRLKEVRDRVVQGTSAPLPKSQFLRIAEYLLSRGNQPRTARAILKGTGISRSSLSQILHRTHKDSFLSSPIPGYSRKKKWSLTEVAAAEARCKLSRLEGQPTLFGTVGDLAGVKAADCGARILNDHNNEPMNALSIAREAIARGYRGRASGPEDEVLLTTAKSFWAALGRDDRFREVRPLVFVLREDGPGEQHEGE